MGFFRNKTFSTFLYFEVIKLTVNVFFKLKVTDVDKNKNNAKVSDFVIGHRWVWGDAIR